MQATITIGDTVIPLKWHELKTLRRSLAFAREAHLRAAERKQCEGVSHGVRNRRAAGELAKLIAAIEQAASLATSSEDT